MSESSPDEPRQQWPPIEPSRREVPADDSPVPAGPATLPFGVRPSQGPDRLVLHPLIGFGVTLLIQIVALVAVLGIVVSQGLLANWAIAPTRFGFFLLLSALAGGWFFYRQTILPRVTFDKEAHLLTLGWRGLRGQRPLSSVIGVQVMQTRKQFGGPEFNASAVTLYQVNLILDDPAERRLNVLTGDPRKARATARLVADFLGVPVLDCEDTPSDAPGAMPIESVAVPSPVVTEPDPEVLLIRPRSLAFLSGFRGMAALWIPLLLCALATRGVIGDWFIVSVVGLLTFTALPAALLHLFQVRVRWVRFDRAQGLLMLGRRPPRPLASVKAVEVVGGVEHQLNLLPDDPRQPRVNLITDMDAALVRRSAERVATFLGVPLLAAGQSTTAARPGTWPEAAAPLELLSRSPLPPGRASVRGPACVVLQGEDALVLRPRSRRSWARLAPAVIPIGTGLFFVWLAWWRVGAGQGALVVSLVLSAVVVLLGGTLSQFAALKLWLRYRARFDRQAGRLTLGWFGLKGTYPLARILAMQLIPAGLVENAAAPFGGGGEHVSYQLNLVMADAYEDRLNITEDSDLGLTRQAGQQVADFLGVPLLDQIADSE
jgi:hypothetical protein